MVSSGAAKRMGQGVGGAVAVGLGAGQGKRGWDGEKE